MHPLNQAVCLRVEGACYTMMDAGFRAHRVPERSCELRSLIGNYSNGDTVARYPGSQKPLNYRGGGDVFEFEALEPPGRPVDHREEVSVALRRGKGPHQIKVNFSEAVVMDGDLL